MRKRGVLCLWLLAACLLLTGCGGRFLERSRSSITPHNATYWENEDADVLRAENYQELVNALLILISDHNEDGVIRFYSEAPNKGALAGDACVEVQQETALGAFLLDYITYEGKAESGYYEMRVRFAYRRTAEEQAGIVNATSTEALPDLLRAAIEEGRGAVAIRFGYFDTDRSGVLAQIGAVHDEIYPPEPDELPPEADVQAPEDADGETEGDGESVGDAENAAEALAPDETQTDAGTEEPSEPDYDLSPWAVLFYPDSDRPEIVEVILKNPDT